VTLGGVYLRAEADSFDFDLGGLEAIFFLLLGTGCVLPEFIRLVGGIAGAVLRDCGAVSYLGG